ncbi:Cysteine sulfinic acid decarboxylase, putative [Pediculus humanus corporis]|uniref:Cysteine sulfinic acid decarboxylase, putative n=1 Tax=Pediculus humanus subsp. corporis TaxID=121224 RepID=E0VPJ6_PEDHC|nr:Cysteine sulfinic acid decarboxylase, putative [Pediculus humanus corporis]EEB15302.1 Cysteine sulfinic acid decarboxylase, putative [Pediculus humanus corporis]
MSFAGGKNENIKTEMMTSSPYEWLKYCVDLLENFNVLEPSMEKSQRVKKIDFTLNEKCESDDKILKLCEDVIKNSVLTNHPHFHNQLYGGTDPYGLVGGFITEALNTNQVTFEIAPVFTLIESELYRKLSSLIGIINGDGIFSPGGSLNNMYAMVLARYKLNPDIKKKGVYCMNKLVAFTSEDSHYSIMKGVNWIGIGIDNVIKIKTDDFGKMIPDHLEKMIIKTKEEGRVPFFVNVTAGTTVLGAFDPIEIINDICSKYNLWMHVDACWGGSLLFSKKYSKVLKGLNKADSVSWNPHKMLGAPLQCSIFLTKHKEILHECNSASATYLFQQDKFYDVSYDTGDKSVQCGRKVDCFKLWLMWKARGDTGFEKLVDQAMECSRYFKDKITNRPGFQLVLPEFECTNVCFWYIPVRLRNMEQTDEWWNELEKVAPKIKEQLTYAGSLMIGYQPLNHKNFKNFFRMVITCHPIRTYQHMDYVIEQIELWGEKI